MYGRLAFSVAVNMEPDILLIDEALSVGDARFRRKSFDKMRELCEQARTIVLVSHALGAIEELCDEAIWMHKGELRDVGRPRRGHRRLHGVPRRRRGRAHDGGRVTQAARRVDAVAAVLEEDAVAGRAPGRLRREVLRRRSAWPASLRRGTSSSLPSGLAVRLDRPDRARVAAEPVAQVRDRAVVGRGERRAGRERRPHRGRVGDALQVGVERAVAVRCACAGRAASPTCQGRKATESAERDEAHDLPARARSGRAASSSKPHTASP